MVQSKEEIKQRRHLYYLAHIEEERQRLLTNKLNNPEKYSEIVHKSREKRKSNGKELEWRLKNRESIRLRNQNNGKKIKLEIVSHYSNGSMKCAKCGFEDIRALQIDHINGGGTAHFKAIFNDRGGSNFYRWLKINSFPSGYQVLCANCNWIKRHENKELGKINKS